MKRAEFTSIYLGRGINARGTMGKICASSEIMISARERVVL